MGVLIVLLLLALALGVGAVIKGLFWLAIIAVVFVVAAGLLAKNALSKRG